MTNKLEGINLGVRVRVTFEGTLKYRSNTHISVMADGGDTNATFYTEEINAPTFKIERLDPPIRVGDVVQPKGLRSSAHHYKVLAVGHNAGRCFLLMLDNAGIVCGAPADLYERVPT